MTRAIMGAALLGALASCGLIVGLKDRELGTPGDGGGETGSESGNESSRPDAPNDGAVDVSMDRPQPPDAPPDAGPDGSDAGLDVFDGNCGDTQADPLNCGACFHDCLGGSCANSGCGAVLIATNQAYDTSTNFRGIAVDTTSVYWTGVDTTVSMGGYVASCPLAGCPDSGPVTVVGNLKSINPPVQVAAGAGTVYWTEQEDAMMTSMGGAYSCSLGPSGSCATSPKVLDANMERNPQAMLLVAPNLYWADRGDNGSLGAVYRCVVGAGGDCGMALSPFASGGGPTLLAANSTHIFWLASAGFTVYSALPDGTGSTNLGATGAIGGLAASDSNIYFADSSNIYECPTTGCPMPPTTLWPNGGAGAAAVDASHLYFLTGTTLYSCLLASCSPQQLVPPLATAHGLAVDAKAVYYSFGTNVYKVAKPIP